jgi:hypothetical protein
MLLGKVYSEVFILAESEPVSWFSLKLYCFRTGFLFTLRYECSETLLQAETSPSVSARLQTET